MIHLHPITLPDYKMEYQAKNKDDYCTAYPAPDGRLHTLR